MTRALVVDCETTGPPDDVPVQVAWLDLGTAPSLSLAGLPGERWFNPGRPIPAGAMGVHHITDTAVSACRPWEGFQSISDVVPEDTGFLIAHNVDYDARALGAPDTLRRIDTLALARSLWPKADNHQLTTLCYYLEPREAHEALATRLQAAHNALADVEACLIVLRHVLAAVRAESWAALWRLSERARVPKVMPFGKHKGLPMADVPRDYKDWLLRQNDVDPYLRKALEAPCPTGTA